MVKVRSLRSLSVIGFQLKRALWVLHTNKRNRHKRVTDN